MYIDSAPETLDPQIVSSASEIIGVMHLFNGLFRKGVDGNAKAECADSYTISDDGLLYTIKLKNELYWSTYKSENQKITPKLTADDFVFGISRVFDKQTKSPFTKQLNNIANANKILQGSLPLNSLGVKAIDELTLEIKLSNPDPSFLDKLCLPGAMPCNQEFFEGTKGAYGLGSKTLLTNGNFSLAAWKVDSGLGLRKIVSGRNDISYLRLVLPSHSDPTSPIERLKQEITSGELVRGNVEEDGFSSLPFSTTTWCIVFNTQNKFLSNKDLRLALSTVASNTDINPDGTKFSTAEGLIPPSITTSQDIIYRDFAGSTLLNVENYAQLFRNGLDSLGLTQLSGLTVLTPDDENINEMFGAINQNWQKELSAFFNVNTVSIKELEALVASGKFDIAVLPISQPENDVGMFLNKFHSQSSANIAFFKSAEYDNALLLAESTQDATDRTTLYAQAEQLLLNNAPITPIFYEVSTFLTTTAVKDIIASPFGPVVDVTFAKQK